MQSQLISLQHISPPGKRRATDGHLVGLLQELEAKQWILPHSTGTDVLLKQCPGLPQLRGSSALVLLEERIQVGDGKTLSTGLLSKALPGTKRVEGTR